MLLLFRWNWNHFIHWILCIFLTQVFEIKNKLAAKDVLFEKYIWNRYFAMYSTVTLFWCEFEWTGNPIWIVTQKLFILAYTCHNVTYVCYFDWEIDLGENSDLKTQFMVIGTVKAQIWKIFFRSRKYPLKMSKIATQFQLLLRHFLQN